MKESGIKLPGYTDTWGVIDKDSYNGRDYWLLENEKWGDETQYIIVEANTKIVVLDDVYNGFLDLVEYLMDEELRD